VWSRLAGSNRPPIQTLSYAAAVDDHERGVVTELPTADHCDPADDDPDTPADAATTSLPARPIGQGEAIDLDTVRIERTPDFDQTRRWIVLCGGAEEERVLGCVWSDGTTSKRRHALGPTFAGAPPPAGDALPNTKRSPASTPGVPHIAGVTQSARTPPAQETLSRRTCVDPALTWLSGHV
jgi:hypothetical protein